MIKIFENLDLQDLDGEIWKNILDYEGDYQVSNIGRVKSIKFGKEKIRKQNKVHGYFRIDLWKNGISKNKLIHRLVYEAHIGKLEEGYDAHHINEDEEDNFVENLESKERGKHMKEHHEGKHHSEKTKKKIGETSTGRKHSQESKNKMSENNFRKVSFQKIIDIQLDIEKEDLTQRQIAKKYNISQSMISNIKNNKI